MKNILITGGLGYIGSHLCVEILKESYNVIIIDDLSNSSFSVLKKIETISNKKINFYEGDFADSKILDLIENEISIDIVIHLAAKKSIPESILNSEIYLENNYLKFLKFLEILKDKNIKNLIFSSSASVYSELNNPPYSEQAELYPGNPYSFSKILCEKLLKNYSDFFNFNSIVLRYFNPVGNESNGSLGDNLKNNDGITGSLNKALKTNTFNIFGKNYDTSDGTCIRDFIHVSDLAKAHIECIHYLTNKKKIYEIFNVGYGHGVSVLEFIKKFNEVNGLNIKIEFIQNRLGDIPVSYSDNKKIINNTNWRFDNNLDTICISLFEYLCKH